MVEVPAEILDQLQAKHQDVAILSANDEVIVVRPPTRPEYKRFRARSVDVNMRADAVEELTKSVLLYPDRTGFDVILDKKPALADVFGAKVLELAGLTQEAEVKKL